MDKPVDIVWFGESGPVWVEAAQTMERAKACVDALPLKTSGGYAVVDHRTGKRMSFEPNLRYARRRVWQTEKAPSSRVKSDRASDGIFWRLAFRSLQADL